MAPHCKNVWVSLKNFSHAVQGDISTFGIFQQLCQLFPKAGALHNLSVRKNGKHFFNIILFNLAVRIIGIFLLIDLFVFSSWWWMFDRFISIIDRKMSKTNEYFINRFTSIVWKNSTVRQISIIKIVIFAPQWACRPVRDDVVE